MCKNLLVLVALFGLATKGHSDELKYCYDENDPNCLGPSKWDGKCKDGKSQSPINLLDSMIEGNQVLETTPISFSDMYRDGLRRFSVENDGKSAVISVIPNLNGTYNVTRGRPAVFMEDILSQEHYLEQIHFHWSPTDEAGSEHTLNNKSFPMEIHMVHYNGRYPNFDAAVASGHSDALAVFGIFVQVGDTNNTDLKPIVEELDDIEGYQDSEAVSEVLNIHRFLPEPVRDGSGANFFTYRGSLTTPPCEELVTWIVFQDPISLSKEQIKEFRKLNEFDGSDIITNYRPVQKQNSDIRIARKFRMVSESTSNVPNYFLTIFIIFGFLSAI